MSNLAKGDNPDFESVSTDRIGSAPVVFSSEHDTIQAALDEAGGGTLLIDDTKTEEGIQIGPEHSDTDVVCLGDNAIEQPANPSLGEAVMRVKDDIASNPENITFVGLHIYNPSLGDADISNEDDLASGDRTSAFEWEAPNASLAVDTYEPRNFRFINPRIHHVNGFGISLNHPVDTGVIRGGHVTHTAYDNYYIKAEAGRVSEDTTMRIEDCYGADSGRHNYSVAGTDAVADAVHISGVGKRAYTGGVDIEHEQHVTLDVDIYESGQSGGTGNVDAGLNISGESRDVGGSVRIHDPNAWGASLSGDLTGLDVTTHQSAAENPAGLPAVYVDGATGDLTATVRGGGAASGAVQVRSSDSGAPSVDATVENAYGPSMQMRECSGARVSLTSINPAQGGGALAGDEKVHLFNTAGSGASEDNAVEIVAVDESGNVADGIYEDGADYNVYRGSVRGAYTNRGVRNAGANSLVGQLIT